SKRDWSSDVCSSDLHVVADAVLARTGEAELRQESREDPVRMPLAVHEHAVVVEDDEIEALGHQLPSEEDASTLASALLITYPERSEERRVGKECRCL